MVKTITKNVFHPNPTVKTVGYINSCTCTVIQWIIASVSVGL